jgi:hypothetical protein
VTKGAVFVLSFNFLSGQTTCLWRPISGRPPPLIWAAHVQSDGHDDRPTGWTLFLDRRPELVQSPAWLHIEIKSQTGTGVIQFSASAKTSPHPTETETPKDQGNNNPDSKHDRHIVPRS